MTDGSSAMIGAEKLEKDFGTTRAVQGISFSVARGEVVGFLGPNGAGKTTTMRMLTGFLAPSSGRVKIGGIDVSERPLEARAKIGYLPESAPLYDEMMVIDFLAFVSRMRGIATGEGRKRLKEIAERCGIISVLGKDIGQLSKGYRQRVGLAQAMLHDPDLLVLDEPTSGLDPNQIVEIRDLIRDLGKDKTVLLSTHILPEVQATCSRVLIINEGKLVADDTPEALSEREGGAIVNVVLAPKNGTPIVSAKVKDLLTGLPGVREVRELREHQEGAHGEPEGAVVFRLTTTGTDDPRAAVFHAAVKHDLVLLDLHREQISLEETFRKLTTGEEATHA